MAILQVVNLADFCDCLKLEAQSCAKAARIAGDQFIDLAASFNKDRGFQYARFLMDKISGIDDQINLTVVSGPEPEIRRPRTTSR